MSKDMLAKLSLCVIVLLMIFVGNAVFANDNNILGKYKSSDGYIISIRETSKDSLYKITGFDPSDYQWESFGFYSTQCNCIKSVFKYLSHKEYYGDNVGYHNFEIKNNGNMIIKRGGWESTGEFGEITYIKTK
jgi:hypothetical protein